MSRQIAKLDRLVNSRKGNPRYRVQFTDGLVAKTGCDSAVGFVIANAEYRDVPVLVTFTVRGDIATLALPEPVS